MRTVIVFLLLALSVACAKGPETSPDGFTEEPAAYPAGRYLSGRGQGETVGLARDRARADLAKVFEVTVRESSRDRLQWQTGMGDKDGLQTQISRDISAQTSQVVKGVKIVETWLSKDGGDYHALAVLDRLQAGNRLRAEIDELDEEIALNIERAHEEDVLVEKISAAYNALNAQLRRRHPQKMLQIVDVAGIGLPGKHRLATLKGHFESLLDRWSIALVVERDELGDVKELLAGALGNVGVAHKASEADADYLLLADLDSEKLKTTDGWYWMRGTLKLSLAELSSGNIIGSHQWSFKSSALQEEMAEVRARDQLSNLLGRELLKVLVEFGDAADRSDR